jgi:hypothetical protein
MLLSKQQIADFSQIQSTAPARASHISSISQTIASKLFAVAAKMSL